MAESGWRARARGAAAPTVGGSTTGGAGGPGGGGDAETGRGGRRTAPRDAAWLGRAALAHVQRFTCSAERLRQVLRRRIDRAQRRDEAIEPTLAADLPAIIEGIVDHLAQLGLLDDAAFARGVALSLGRKGTSQRGVVAGLRQRGLDAETIESTVAVVAAEAADEGIDPEWSAAVAYARRRRLGPFCTGDRAARRDKDLAALGRRGFAYALARRVVDAPDAEALAAGDPQD